MNGIDELMLMIAKFIYREYSAKRFVEEFEDHFHDVYEELQAENPVLSDFISDEIVYPCAFFDIHETKEKHLYSEDEFREIVAKAYREAIPLAAKMKVS